MAMKEKVGALVASILIVGCASQPGANQQSASEPAATTAPSTAKASEQSSKSGVRVVKSRNGNFDGEIFGTPAPKSKFAKLQIGMTMREVSELIGAPDDIFRHETGKRWIPFYFGNDAQRLQVLYKGEGCLSYTGGNVFGGGGNELITITVEPKGRCLEN